MRHANHNMLVTLSAVILRGKIYVLFDIEFYITLKKNETPESQSLYTRYSDNDDQNYF